MALLVSQAQGQIRQLTANAVAAAKGGQQGTAWSLWQQASAIAGSTNAPGAFTQELAAARQTIAQGQKKHPAHTGVGGAGGGLGAYSPRVFLGDATQDNGRLARVNQLVRDSNQALAVGNADGAGVALTHAKELVAAIGDAWTRGQAQRLVDSAVAGLNALGPEQSRQRKNTAYGAAIYAETTTAREANGNGGTVDRQGNIVKIAGGLGDFGSTFDYTASLYGIQQAARNGLIDNAERELADLSNILAGDTSQNLDKASLAKNLASTAGMIAYLSGDPNLAANKARWQAVGAGLQRNADVLNHDILYKATQGNVAGTTAGAAADASQDGTANTYAGAGNIIAGGPGGSSIVDTGMIPAGVEQALGADGVASGLGGIFKIVPWWVWAGAAGLYLAGQRARR